MTRISKQELYRLRNEIPIGDFIADVLKIPSQTTDGRFRFRCPLCNEFNTAVKPETNLARCFICEKNFNTIDLTMQIRNLSFVECVTFLRQYKKTGQKPCLEPHPALNPKKAPTHIADVLSSMIPPPLKSNQNLDQRLLALEEKVEHLIHRLDKLTHHLK